MQCVTGGGRDWVVWRAYTGDYVFDKIPNLQIVYHPKQKPRRGGGFRQINTCRQVPLLVNLKKDDI